MVSLFGLAPDGVYPATDVATSAVSSYLAISPLPVCFQYLRGLSPPLFLGGFASLAVGEAGKSAVYFLWHFPSPHGVRPLAGILLCGARTFLSVLVDAATVWPASLQSLSWELGKLQVSRTLSLRNGMPSLSRHSPYSCPNAFFGRALLPDRLNLHGAPAFNLKIMQT